MLEGMTKNRGREILRRGYCHKSQERRLFHKREEKIFLVFSNVEVTADFDKNSFSLMIGLKRGWTYELMGKRGECK